jgi:hypothetical protein
MMRVATELSEQDVLTLQRICSVQCSSLRSESRRPDINEANSAWADLERQFKFFRSPEVYGTCLKLQSLGLIMAMDRIPTTLGLQSVPFALLPKADEFLKYLQDEARTSL